MYVVRKSSEYKPVRTNNKQQRTPWSESASELYRQSDRCFSEKLMPTFADRECHVASMTFLRPYSRFSKPEPLLFLSSSFSIVLTRLSGPCFRLTTSQLAPGIEPGLLDLYPGSQTTTPQRRSTSRNSSSL
jgi:hypothetical protein